MGSTSSLRPRRARPSGRKSPFACRPGLESLEDRTLLSVLFRADPTPPAITPRGADLPLGAVSPLRPVDPVLALSDKDPGNVAVASQNGLRVSPYDGADIMSRPPTLFPDAALSDRDAATAFDSQGRLFWVATDTHTNSLKAAQINPSLGTVIGGPSQVVAAPAGSVDDHAFLAGDAGGNLFLAWTRTTGSQTQVYVARSSGGSSWSTPVLVSDSSEGTVGPASVAAGPSGDVFVAYHSQPVFSGGAPDGGSGRTYVVRFDNNLDNPPISKTLAFTAGQSDITFNVQDVASPRKIPGTQFLTQGAARPRVLVDPTPERPNTVYVVAADDPTNGAGAPYARVRLARSTDDGRTWALPGPFQGFLTNPAVGSNFQLFPTAAIDRFGTLVVAWYDNARGLRNGGGSCNGGGSGNFCLDVLATYTADGAQDFAPLYQVNDAANPFNPDAGAPVVVPGSPPTTGIGDKFGIAVFGGTAYVAWNGNTFSGGTPTGQQPYFNAFPVRGGLSATADEGQAGSYSLTLRSMIGNPAFVEVLVNGARQYAGLWTALATTAFNPTDLRTGGIRFSGQFGGYTVNIENTFVNAALVPAPVAVTLGGGGDTVNLSPVAQTLGDLKAPVSIVAAGDHDFLNVNDQLDPLDQVFTLSATGVQNASSALITYANVGTVVVNGGRGSNSYAVLGTSNNVQTTLNAGNGDDTISVGSAAHTLDTFLGPLTVNGQAGTDALTVHDEGAAVSRSYLLTDTTLDRTGAGRITYGGVKFLTVNGAAAGSPVHVDNTAGGALTTFNTGAGADTVDVVRTGGALVLNNTGGSDTVTLHSRLPNAGLREIGGRVTVQSPAGQVGLTVNDADDPAYHSATLNATSLTGLAGADIFFFGNLAALAITGPSTGEAGGNTFTVANTPPAAPTAITTGLGDDTVTVQGTTAPLTLVNPGGIDSVTAGNAANGVGNLLGLVTLVNDLGTILTVNDAAAFANRTVTIDPSAISFQPSAAAVINYAQTHLRTFTVNLGSGNDTITVNNTPNSSLPFTLTTLNAGNLGTNVFNVRATAGTVIVTGGNGTTTVNAGNLANKLDDLAGGLTVNGGSGNSTLNVNDQGTTTAKTYTISGGSVARTGGPTITYSSLKTLVVNTSKAGSTITVSGTSATTTVNAQDGNDNITVSGTGAATTVNAGNGDNNFSVGDGANTLSSIQGALTVTSGVGTNTLTINDGGSIPARSYTLTRTTLERSGAAVITYTGFQTLTVNGGSGGNTVRIAGTANNATTTFNTGTGSDTVGVESNNGPLTINGQNGLDTVTVSDAGRVARVDNVTVTNTGGSTNLIVDDSAETTERFNLPNVINATSVTFNSVALGRSRVNFVPDQLNTLTVRGGHGQNTFRVDATPGSATRTILTTLYSGNNPLGDNVFIRAVSAGGPLTVNAQDGDDEVFVSNANNALDDIQDSLVIHGDAGEDTLVADDSGKLGNQTYTVTATTVGRGGMVPFRYDGVETLTLNAGRGNDTIQVRSTSVTTQINGGLGDDTVQAGSGGAPPAVSTLDGIRGDLMVDGGAGNNALQVFDQSNVVSPTYTLTATTVRRTNTAVISYQNINSLLVVGGAVTNTFEVLNTGVTTVISSGTGAATVNVRGTTAALTVNVGAGGSNTVHVGTNGPPPAPESSLDNVQGAVTVNGAGGVSVVTIDDQGNPRNAARTYRVTATTVTRAGDAVNPGVITYNGLRSLTVNGSSNYVVVNTPAATAVTLNAGPDDDTITVQGNQGPLTVNAGAGNDSITVGGADNTLDGIVGPLVVTGGDGNDTLTVNDQGRIALGTYTVTNTRAGRTNGPGVTYATVETLVLNAGNGGNSITVASTAAGTDTTVNTGVGVNLLSVGSGGPRPAVSTIDGILGPLTLNGGPALNTVSVNDQSAAANRLRRYQVGPNSLLRLNDAIQAAPIRFANIAARTLNPSSNVDVLGVAPNTSWTINTSDEDTVVNVGSTSDTLDQIQGSLTVNGGNGANELNVNDQGSVDVRGYTITDTTVRRLAVPGLGEALVTYGGIQRVTLNAARSINLITVLNTAVGTLTTVNAGIGDATVNVRKTLGALTVNTQGGIDLINVGSGDPRPAASTIDNILGLVTVNGAGVTTLNINDQSKPALAARQYTNDGTTVRRLNDPVAAAPVRYFDVSFLNINGSSNYRMTNTAAGTLTTINAGDSGDTVDVEATTGELVVNLGRGDDTVNISPTAANLDTIQGGVVVNGGAGTDTLMVNDSANTIERFYTLADGLVTRDGAAAVTYRNIINTVVNGGFGDDTYVVLNTTFFNTTLNVGLGVNTVNVRGTLGPLALNMGLSSGAIDVGDANARLNAIVGPVTITGGPLGGRTLTVHDEGGSLGRNYVLTNNTLTWGGAGVPQLTFSALASLAINGSQDTDTFTVQDTPAGLTTILNTGAGSDVVDVQGTTGPLTVYTNAGADTSQINVGNNGLLAGIHGALLVQNLDGASRLVVDGSQEADDKTVTLDLDQITGLAPVPIRFLAGNLAYITLFGGEGNNTYNVIGTTSLLTTIIGGSGDDTFNVGSGMNTLAEIGGPLTLAGGGGTNQLNLLDRVSAPNAYTITGNTAKSEGSALITYANMTFLTLFASPASFTALVGGLGAGPGDTAVQIVGNVGPNTLAGPDTSNLWHFTGDDAGELLTPAFADVTFTGIQSFYGGQLDDTFAFDDGVRVNGFIDGKDGVDTLDYTAWANPPVVDLASNFAANVGLGVFNIEQVVPQQQDRLAGGGRGLLAPDAPSGCVRSDGPPVAADPVRVPEAHVTADVPGRVATTPRDEGIKVLRRAALDDYFASALTADDGTGILDKVFPG